MTVMFRPPGSSGPARVVHVVVLAATEAEVTPLLVFEAVRCAVLSAGCSTSRVPRVE